MLKVIHTHDTLSQVLIRPPVQIYCSLTGIFPTLLCIFSHLLGGDNSHLHRSYAVLSQLIVWSMKYTVTKQRQMPVTGSHRTKVMSPDCLLIFSIFAWRKETLISYQSGWQLADILTCHSRNNTYVTNNINDGSVLFKCPGKPVSQHAQYQGPETKAA